MMLDGMVLKLLPHLLDRAVERRGGFVLLGDEVVCIVGRLV